MTVGLVSALLLPALAFGLRVAAQAPNAGASTLTGIYSPEQARRGEDTYMSLCVGCHPAGTYATEAFKTTWSGRSLGDLFTLISETMPKNEPGSLSPQEYAQVVAYILKVNGLPAGKTDIPTDIARLKQIRFEIPGPSQKKERLRPQASAGEAADGRRERAARWEPEGAPPSEVKCASERRRKRPTAAASAQRGGNLKGPHRAKSNDGGEAHHAAFGH